MINYLPPVNFSLLFPPACQVTYYNPQQLEITRKLFKVNCNYVPQDNDKTKTREAREEEQKQIYRDYLASKQKDKTR